MEKTENIKIEKKCYNSWSCILSVLIIVVVLGSILYDYVYSKPHMQKDITDIKIEVREIHEKIEAQNNVYFNAVDTISNKKQQ